MNKALFCAIVVVGVPVVAYGIKKFLESRSKSEIVEYVESKKEEANEIIDGQRNP